MGEKKLFCGKKKIIVAVICIVVVAIIAVVLVAIQQQKIDVSSYANVKVEGLNTQGIASDTFDSDTFTADLAKKQHINIIAANTFARTIHCDLNHEKSLKNGDVIQMSIRYDATLASQLGVKLKNFQKSITVTGLPEGKEIDAFKDIKVSYSGISPEGKVSIINNSTDPFLSSMSYTIMVS